MWGGASTTYHRCGGGHPPHTTEAEEHPTVATDGGKHPPLTTYYSTYWGNIRHITLMVNYNVMAAFTKDTEKTQAVFFIIR